MNKSRLLTTLLLITLSLAVLAQPKEVATNHETWYSLQGFYPISQKVTLASEVHYRRVNWFEEQSDYLLRPLIYFKASSHWTIHAGYTFAKFYPVGLQPSANQMMEHNTFLGAAHSSSLGRLKIQNRFRVEERWRTAVLPDGNHHAFNTYNRFRYRIRLQYPFGKQQKWLAQVQEELWLNFGQNAKTTFNQNWLIGGIGYRWTPKFNTLLNYHWQYLPKSDQIHVESNLIFQLEVNYQIDLTSK
ncbi:MAG: DUF2490 domain-containing protein [Cyclobacteriaceae bacterium]